MERTLYRRTCRIILLIVVMLMPLQSFGAEYQQVAGLIDLRSTFSDGEHDIESLIRMARDKGFEVIVINDHDRMAMEYGLPPFRKLIKKKVERNSINKSGARLYLNEIKAVEKKYPHMIIIPGSETGAHYYWTGSLLQRNLTAHNHEKRLLTIGMENPEDYENLPILDNGFSTRYARMAVPEIIAFLVLLFLGVVLIRWKGFYRIAGIVVVLWAVASIVNSDLFRSSPFDQYHGDQGIRPYQLVIDYVNSKGGMTFWNYPETRSGIRKLGPIFVSTPSYPGVLLESERYTGFSALYGDTITITEPGGIWDKTLDEYCRGSRKRPIWGIATADFHEEGGSGEQLGNFQTVFFLRDKSKKDVLDALKNGKMYAYRGLYPQFVRLDDFSVDSSDGMVKGISGDEVRLDEFPRIKIALTSVGELTRPVTVRLIRSGAVIGTFRGTLPLSIDYEDRTIGYGRKEYYRFDMHGEGKLVSNPIFVRYEGESEGGNEHENDIDKL